MSLRPSAKTEIRRNRYKVAVDAVEGRRMHEDHMVEIRKNKREENLQKRRCEVISSPTQTEFGVSCDDDDDDDDDDGDDDDDDDDDDGDGDGDDDDNDDDENVSEMVPGIWSEDSNLQLETTTLLHKLLSREQNPPINDVIQSDVVPRVVTFLSKADFPRLQFEAAWTLTNIASGTSENTKTIVESGAIPILVNLLSSANEQVREQAVWALGNVAGDSPKCRDIVLSFGAMLPLLSQFNEHTTLSMLRNATWTLSNLCRGKPQPSFEQTSPALPVLKSLVQLTDVEVLVDACWALAYLSDNTNEHIQAVIDADVIPRIIQLLAHTSLAVLIPALRAVGNLVTGNNVQTQTVVDNQVLPSLLVLITQTYTKSIKKEACWTISNITAGSSSQIQAVIEAGVIQALVWVLQNAEFEVKKEAAWAISNATTGGTHDQIKFMVSQGCIWPICDLLTCPDPRIVMVCLEAVENILVVGEALKSSGLTGDENLFAALVEEGGGLEKIENLQTHDNDEIYQKAVKILEKFWTEDDDEEEGGNNESLPPHVLFNFI
ncbi:Importin subunit alpha-3 [Hirschfeldia incana]|nr:Importin subunit alpha-3 [Hirschfeldia incana]